MNKNVFAHTEPGGNLPGYVSINRSSDGKHTISVRARGQQYASEVQVSPEFLESLSISLIDYLHGEPVATKQPAGEVQEAAKELVRLADILRDCKRLVSSSGKAEAVMRDAALLLLSSPPPVAPAVPDGMALVPVEVIRIIKNEFDKAGIPAPWPVAIKDALYVLLASAPQQPKELGA